MRTRIGLGFACALALTVGCGGNFIQVGGGDGGAPGSDGGTDAPGKSETGSPDSGGPDTGPGETCPTSAPTDGAACSSVGLECEYGSNPNPDCNQLWECSASGWTNDTPKSACVPASDCPASYPFVSGGHPVTCDMSELDLTCSYQQGTCICSDGSLPTVGGPDWLCIPATASCPSPRPALGSACSKPGTECDYGACSGGIAIECKDGVWQQDKMVACPG